MQMSPWLVDLFENKEGRIVGQGAWKHFPLYWAEVSLTQKCTRACDFCYVSNQRAPHISMPEDVFARLCDWLPATYYQHNYLFGMVVFLGGEPLLETQKIKRLMDAVFEKTPGMLGVIHTNGDLLNRIDWHNVEKINQWTLHITDLPMGEIDRRMKIIDAHTPDNPGKQGLTFVWDKLNMERAEDIINYAIDNNFYVRSYHNAADRRPAYEAELISVFGRILPICKRRKYRPRYNYSLFLDEIAIDSSFEGSPWPCGRRLFMVLPDGRVTSCTRDSACSFAGVGTIYDDDIIQRIAVKKDIRRKWENHPECADCSVKNYCQGGCFADRVLHSGNTAGSFPLCIFYKDVLPRLNFLAVS
jgi:uncharacterized protein